MKVQIYGVFTMWANKSLKKIGYDLAVGVVHRADTVPVVIGSTIDVGADVRHTRHDGAHSLGDFTLTVKLVAWLCLSYLLHMQNYYDYCLYRPQ